MNCLQCHTHEKRSIQLKFFTTLLDCEWAKEIESTVGVYHWVEFAKGSYDKSNYLSFCTIVRVTISESFSSWTLTGVTPVSPPLALQDRHFWDLGCPSKTPPTCLHSSKGSLVCDPLRPTNLTWVYPSRAIVCGVALSVDVPPFLYLWPFLDLLYMVGYKNMEASDFVHNISKDDLAICLETFL